MEEVESTTNQSMQPDQNFEAALTYLVPFVTAAALYFSKEDNKYVRFHAVQAILFWLLVFVIFGVSNALFVFALVLTPLVSFASFGLWVFLMWKAYNNEMYMLPYIGKIAKDQVDGKYTQQQ